jgi:hypothetical protein
MQVAPEAREEGSAGGGAKKVAPEARKEGSAGGARRR